MQIQHARSRIIKAALAWAIAVSGFSTAQAQAGSDAKLALASAKAATATAEQKICATEHKVGSRIPKRVCRTAAEWEIERQSREQKAFDPHQRN